LSLISGPMLPCYISFQTVEPQPLPTLWLSHPSFP
jgi:hypothetical protein